MKQKNKKGAKKFDEAQCNGETSPEKSINDTESNVIEVRNASLHYGSGQGKVPVLVGIDMQVSKGSIYGLLGPSGCGKTTLIHCIVGKKNLMSGEMTVFGETPGSEVAGLAGPRIGYMPQELGLIWELTIRETLLFYGWISDLSKERIKSRTDFMIDLLDLPKDDRLIVNLSGGQQRRVSLAVALLHEPELLILDEPTVGVDPILRKIIWSHLLKITRASHFQTTIVITTHFIEEARQADAIGMMRFGRMLAEGAPGSLLILYKKVTLENVFMHLCLGDDDDLKRQNIKERVNNSNMILEGRSADDLKQQDEDKKNVKEHVKDGNKQLKELSYDDLKQENGAKKDVEEDTKEHNMKLEGEDDPKDLQVPVVDATISQNRRGSQEIRSWYYLLYLRVFAIGIRDTTRLMRNFSFFTFLFVLPTLLFSLFYVTIGRNPKGMTLGIFNEDIETVSCPGKHTSSYGCILQNRYRADNDNGDSFSCRYLSYIDSEIIRTVSYDNLEDAEQAVKDGKHWGFIHFKENFTNVLLKRFMPTMLVSARDDNIFDQADVHATLDMSNQIIGHYIQLHLLMSYREFLQGILSSCNLNENVLSLPVSFKDPIYGTNDLTLTDFATPGCILTIIYFLSVAYTSMSLIMDRKDGVTDRNWVAGVKPGEVVFAYIVYNFCVSILQVLLMLAVVVFGFQSELEGPLICCLILVVLQGMDISLSTATRHFPSPIGLGFLSISLLPGFMKLGEILFEIQGLRVTVDTESTVTLSACHRSSKLLMQ